ncbi:hypothetical protein KAH55_10475, partial [bacterium]|nr:hypothetical protein [bacterium]
MKKCCLILLFAGFFGLFLSLAHAENSNVFIPQHRASGPAMRDLTGAHARFLKQNSTLGLGKMNANAVQDLKVMAIRVQFVPDTSTATTGDGTFDLGASSDYFVDRPPHNRPYFSAQLQAVSHYFEHVSNSQLKLSGIENEFGDVFPQDTNSAYSLPHDMSYYGADDDLIRERRLAELFQDAWMAADADPALDFSQYDIFVVFHAGVGGDIAFDFDTSPFDISSAFISSTDLGKQLANEQPGYAGIPVNDGSFHIPEGIILPETQSQEGINFGMLGTAALMFGSQLGMPNLFNTETGAAGIGKWGLMDQGSGNFLGLIPAQPCAWTKLFMGWEVPIVISEGDQIPVAAALADNPNKIYKIIINANEYFLIENRQQHMLKTPDLAVGYDQNGVRVEMHRDYSFAQTATDDSFKVLVSVDEYDYDVPGSGILIWHIDEQLILEKLATNTINSDPDSRGVDLEEAHGSQDIGGTFGFLSAASGSENGIAENAFFAGNESNLLVNNATTVVFGPNTRPGSGSNSRAESGIQINNISAIAPTMYFDLSNGAAETGFPQFIPETTAWTPNSLMIIDIEQDAQREIFAASTNGTIYGWKGDGRKIIENTDTFEKTQLNGSSDIYSLAIFAEAGDSILTAPGYADLSGDQVPEILVATASGKVFAWHTIDSDVDGRADLVAGFPKNIDGCPTTAGMNLPSGIAGITGESVAWGLDNGSTVLVSEDDIHYLKCGDQPIAGLAFNPYSAAIFFTDTAGKMYRYQNTQMAELG